MGLKWGKLLTLFEYNFEKRRSGVLCSFLMFFEMSLKNFFRGIVSLPPVSVKKTKLLSSFQFELPFTQWNGRNIAGIDVSHPPMHKNIKKKIPIGCRGPKICVFLSFCLSVPRFVTATMWNNFLPYGQMATELSGSAKLLASNFWTGSLDPETFRVRPGPLKGPEGFGQASINGAVNLGQIDGSDVWLK